MKKLISVMMAVLFFVLLPTQLSSYAMAAERDDNGSVSPNAQVLPGLEDGMSYREHFSMTAAGVTQELWTGGIKYITTANLHSNTQYVCISGNLSHTRTNETIVPKMYVGFCTYNIHTGQHIPTFCDYIWESDANIYIRVDASLFSDNTEYYGYIRNELYSSGNTSEYNGSISGSLLFYSLYTT